MKNVLLTGGRSPIALELARLLHAAGHKVIVAETSKWHVSRFSNAIHKHFTIPSPRFDDEKFIQALNEIIEKNKIDLLIPIYEEVLYLARALDRFPSYCQIFCSSFDLLCTLHNKWHFIEKLKSLGFLTPQTFLVRSHEDFKAIPFSSPYALKASFSRASQNIIKVVHPSSPPQLEIKSHNPWIAQEWLEGKKYCSYSIAQQGTLRAHGVYPVRFAIDGNSCLTFEAVDHPGIQEWVESFVKAVNFTGQIAFDFIEVPDRGLYAIECNPRATSGIHLFKNENKIDQAFFNSGSDTICPKIGSEKQLAIGMLLYGWRTNRTKLKFSSFLRKFFGTQDVIFQSQDIKPFLAQSLIFPHYWYKSKKLKLSLPAMFTHDVDWNGEKASHTN